MNNDILNLIFIIICYQNKLFGICQNIDFNMHIIIKLKQNFLMNCSDKLNKFLFVGMFNMCSYRLKQYNKIYLI